jgi:fibronectin type 3 domain-containing protein
MKRLIAILSLSILILFVSGCEKTPLPPKQPVIDETLPTVSDIKFLSEITEIGFEWTPSYDERVEGYYIYRSNPQNDNGKLQRIEILKDKYISHFVDTKLTPGTVYNYRFSTYSKEGRESIPSSVISPSTKGLIESVSFVKAISGLPHRVKIIWRPHPLERVQSYIVERSEFSTTKWEQIGTIDGRLNAEYIDAGLGDNHVYKYRVKVKTYDGLVSNPSEIVEAGTKPLPKPIENLKATATLPKKIVLNWDASSEKDFIYYKVYRALNPLLFYTYRAKTVEPTFEDLISENGQVYYYKVTAVDKDGLESYRQENAVVGSTLGVPLEVVITSSNQDDRSVNISWSTQDNRAVKYNVIKEFKSQKQVITGINAKSFIDRDVVKGVEYKYSVVAIDEYGLASKPSENIIISIPKE